MRAMRRKKLGLAAAIIATGLMTVAPSATAVSVPAASPATACATVYWGSLTKTVSTHARSTSVDDVRTGRHACFDRLVIDLTGKKTGYTVKYVNALYAPGSGKKVTLRGGATLSITVNAPAYNSKGQPTYTPGATIRSLDYTTFRQLAYLGSFEGQTDWGLSTRARLPMRAFTLDGPGTGSRLVIDVAHHW